MSMLIVTQSQSANAGRPGGIERKQSFPPASFLNFARCEGEIMKTCYVFTALLLTACASGKHTNWTEFARQKHPWGYYVGNVETRWDSDGRTMTLLSELRYVDPNGEIWVAPAGSVVDGASIPRAL